MKREAEKILKPVHPNVGVRQWYRKKLIRLIDQMHASVCYWVTAAWKANEPVMAQDEPPAAALARVLRALSRRWNKNFNQAAQDLAKYFAEDIDKRSVSALKHILEKGGFSVRFKLTPAMRDVLNATIQQNIALIKSIPQQYLPKVQQAVMASAQSGRDLKKTMQQINHTHTVTRKRAALISLDQTNKATSAMVRARQLDLGIEEGIWLHSHAGKTPRPTHVKNDGKKFSLKTGWYDPAVKQYIMPGELIHCRCNWKPVIKGLAA